MPTDVIMPQMGESIFEGTITKWLKKPGDKVQRDEPLFEISTDKVDAEIPAPASGVLQEIKVAEGNTVQVNTIVGTISADGESAAPAKTSTPASQAPAVSEKKEPPKPSASAAPPVSARQEVETHDEDVRSSPLVRKIARENNVDLSQVTGTGLGGRITKQDIMAYIEKGPAASPAPASPSSGAASLAVPFVSRPRASGFSATNEAASTSIQGATDVGSLKAVTTGQRVFTAGNSFHAWYIAPILQDISTNAGYRGHEIVGVSKILEIFLYVFNHL